MENPGPGASKYGDIPGPGRGKGEEIGSRVTLGSGDPPHKFKPNMRKDDLHLKINLRQTDIGCASESAVKRSKSDVQDLFKHCESENTDKRKKITSSIVKRSKSFQKIFSHSMLSKSREYNFQ